MYQPKLIMLRGPAGAGKSTTAKILLENASKKTCLIEQDYYRFIFRPYENGSKANAEPIHNMILQNVLIALNEGYNVILEGIFSTKSYKKIVDEILEVHPAENYFFYFDISLDETLRRHAQRPSKNTPPFTLGEMKSWYPSEYVAIHPNEVRILESSSLEDTIALISRESSFS